MITKDEVEKALPPSLKSAATQQFTDRINNIVSDPHLAEQVSENFISFAKVMGDGRFKTEDYLTAVAYVTHKLHGDTNQDAYAKALPGRYQVLVARGTSQKDISAYVSAYHKGKLVQLIMEQTLTPIWVLNQHIYQQAINVQAELMTTAVSEKVRTDAANSILTHLAKPKDSVPAVAIQINQDSGFSELKDLLTQLAQKQTNLIENGVTAQEIAAQPLIEHKKVS